MESMIRGYQYKNTWLSPVIEEELLSQLSCKREIGNAYDTHAVAVCNIIYGDIKTVGCAKYLHRICAVQFLLDEVVVQSCVLSKGIADAPQICYSIDGLIYIFLVRRIYCLCSNPTN